MDAARRNYLLEEEKQRRQEIENLIAKLELDQRNGLIFTGGIWAWLVTNLNHFGPEIGWVIAAVPCVVVMLFLYRWQRIENEIQAIAEYIKCIEDYFKLPAGLGWERWISQKREKNDVASPSGSKNFWYFVITANLAIAILFVAFRDNQAMDDLLQPELTKKVERWMSQQPFPKPSYEEAVRQLVEKGLAP